MLGAVKRAKAGIGSPFGKGKLEDSRDPSPNLCHPALVIFQKGVWGLGRRGVLIPWMELLGCSWGPREFVYTPHQMRQMTLKGLPLLMQCHTAFSPQKKYTNPTSCGSVSRKARNRYAAQLAPAKYLRHIPFIGEGGL